MTGVIGGGMLCRLSGRVVKPDPMPIRFGAGIGPVYFHLTSIRKPFCHRVTTSRNLAIQIPIG